MPKGWTTLPETKLSSAQTLSSCHHTPLPQEEARPVLVLEAQEMGTEASNSQEVLDCRSLSHPPGYPARLRGCSVVVRGNTLDQTVQDQA